jgi:hypothetical protein
MFFNEDSVHTAQASVTLPVQGEFVRLRMIEDAVYAGNAATGKVEIELLPGQSEILVFGADTADLPALDTPKNATVLTPTYHIALADSEDLSAFYDYKTTSVLGNITAASEKPAFSGRMRYTFTLQLDKVPAGAVLDLGRVGHTARVWINGTDAGIRITAPYAFPIETLLVAGENTVTVEVANTLVGKHRDRFSHCMPITPSGLLGPVKLIEY